MKFYSRFSMLLLALVAAGLSAAAASYYVAPAGNDTDTGTLAAPWRTVQKAASTLTPGDTVLVRGGVYNKRVTVNVSGSMAGGRVTFQNYPGETPVLDGSGLTVPSGENGLFLLANRSQVTIQGFGQHQTHFSFPVNLTANIGLL